MDELELYKTDINLTEYAAANGYEIDRRESARSSIVMRSGSDKVIISRLQSDQWIFFSVRDDRDNGIIIDFIQNRKDASLAEIGRGLLSWTSGLPISSYAPEIDHSTKDRAKVAPERASATVTDVTGI